MHYVLSVTIALACGAFIATTATTKPAKEPTCAVPIKASSASTKVGVLCCCRTARGTMCCAEVTMCGKVIPGCFCARS